MADWDCDAYKTAPPNLRATWCFVGEPDGPRVCADAVECRALMVGQRQEVFDRIQALAATGDLTGMYLAEEFTAPEQLLTGTPLRDPLQELPAPMAELARQLVLWGVPGNVAAMAIRKAFNEGRKGQMELENKQCSNTKPHDAHWWDGATKWCGGVENDDGTLPTN